MNMSDQSPSPTPFEKELRETVDLTGKIVARISDRVDSQTKVLKELDGTVAEARAAAFTAADQTDPESYGEMIGKTIEGRIADSLKRLDAASAEVLKGLQHSHASYQETTTAHSNTLRLIDDLHRKQHQDRRWLPWVGLGAVVLALVLAVTLPRFSAINGATCAVFGGEWLTTPSNGYACVRYQE